MPFCLIRDVSGGVPSGKQGQGVTLNVRRLTIGSATDQALHLSVAGVDPRHAHITATGDGRLLLSVLSPKGVIVNTRKMRRASLWPGDQLRIGRAVISVERPLSAQVFLLKIAEPPPEDDEEEEEAAAGRVDGGLSISFWSWTLTIGVTILFLAIPLTGTMVPKVGQVLRASVLLPSDSLWNPGPLHAAHQSIGTDCNACHKDPFVAVRDQECATCHAEVQHHVDVRTADVSLFEGDHCTSCHKEHKQPAALVENDPRLCTDCHAHLERLKPHPGAEDVTDFGLAHPEFRLSVLANQGQEWHPVRLDRRQSATFVEHSHLRFSHAQHLNPKGIKSPTGERVLTCQECHKPDPSGREMMPIRMTDVCIKCHSLRFDEQDPGSGLPHGDLQAAFRTVQEHFSREYLQVGAAVQHAESDGSGGRRRPGPAVLQGSGDERAMVWVNERATKVIHELMEKRVCVECHEVLHVPGATGLDQWRIRPVQLTSDWMPFARFDHAAHNTSKCQVCHTQAERSEHATDILIPTIAKCRECHGGAEDTRKVASSCLMCHQFHLPNHGRFLTAAATAGAGPR